MDGPALSNGTLNEAGTVTLVFYADLTADSGRAYRIISAPVTVIFGN